MSWLQYGEISRLVPKFVVRSPVTESQVYRCRRTVATAARSSSSLPRLVASGSRRMLSDGAVA